ncbi:dicarboxylate/amino acid:cation symporter, partial [Pseudoalteromonas ruthenica]
AVGVLFKLILACEVELLLDLGLFAFHVKGFYVDGLFNIGGQIFIASLNMLVVPLV